MAERKDCFLVGYKGTGNVVYGKRHLGVARDKCKPYQDYSHTMTVHQAKRGLKKMPCKGARIFKIVDVTDKIIKKKKGK